MSLKAYALDLVIIRLRRACRCLASIGHSKSATQKIRSTQVVMPRSYRSPKSREEAIWTGSRQRKLTCPRIVTVASSSELWRHPFLRNDQPDVPPALYQHARSPGKAVAGRWWSSLAASPFNIPAGKSHMRTQQVENLPQSSFSKFVFGGLVALAGSVHRMWKRSPQGLAVYQT